MAVKIVYSPKNVAVKFRCSCGCEFWADKYDMKSIAINGVSTWEAECPNCYAEVTSKENPVSSSEVFNIFDKFSNWIKEREQKREEIEVIKRERAYIESKRYYGD